MVLRRLAERWNFIWEKHQITVSYSYYWYIVAKTADWFWMGVLESMMAKYDSEYELGRRYLANMMDTDLDNFSQEDVDVCCLMYITIYYHSFLVMLYIWETQ